MTRHLSILSILALFAVGWLASNWHAAGASQTGAQLHPGRMTIQWNDELKISGPGEQDTTTKKLDAQVVFDVSEEQLIFFNPNFKGAPIPMTQVYGFDRSMGQPVFTGPLGGQLVSWNGAANYSRTVQHPSSSESGEGQGTLSQFTVTFSGAEFQSVSAAAAPVSVTTTAGSSNGGTTTRTSQEVFVIELGMDRGTPPPGWTVTVNHKPGSYRYIVTANFTHSSQGGETQYAESASFTLTFDLSGEEEIEAVMIPQDKGKPENEKYPNWMPEAGNDEDTAGNSLHVSVVLQPKGQEGKMPSKTGKFHFELADVSHEPGVCLNWPPEGLAKTTPDLKIDGSSNRQLHPNGVDGQSADSDDKLLASSVTVSSYDWGAYGKLKVTVTLDDGTTVVAHLKDEPDIESLTIPKDDNGNHIADAWERKMGLSGDVSETSDDDDSPAGDGTKGDGLSAYEEYRGFQVQGHHISTDPKVKDLFVYDQDDMTLGYFGASGLDLHSVRSEEFTFSSPGGGGQNPWVINFNSGFGNLGKQHLLFLRNATLGNGKLGDSGGINPGPPKTTYWIKLDVAYTASLGGVNELQSTIAHELAHRTNVWHHGDKDYDVGKVEKELSPGNWVEMLKRKPDDVWTVSAQGGQSSGADCIMRYELIDFFEWDAGPYRWTKPPGALQRGGRYRKPAPPGTTFCSDFRGAGVNAPGNQPAPLAGDATRGICQKQFCVNDVKTCNYSGLGRPGA